MHILYLYKYIFKCLFKNFYFLFLFEKNHENQVVFIKNI